MVNTYSHISFKKLIIKHQNINVGFILFFSFWTFHSASVCSTSTLLILSLRAW